MSTIKMRSFSGVAAGQKATLSLPIGNTYHRLFIRYSGITLAQIGEIRVVANGDVLDRYTSAEQLRDFNSYRGILATEKYLEINFERSEMLDRATREVSAIGTGLANDPFRINTLAIEIELSAEAVAPVLECWADQSPPRLSGVVRKTRHFVHDVSLGGEYEIYDLPRGEEIDQIFFAARNAEGMPVSINSLELRLNSSIVFQRPKILNEHFQKNGVRKVNSSYYVYDPSEAGYGTESLTTAGLNEMRFVLDVAEPCRVTSSVAYFGTIPTKAAAV